ncbi:MAG: glycoside hydrolase family 16 protein [Bacteroidota bacterium]
MRKNIFKNLIIIFLLIFLFFQSESCKKNNEEVIIPPDLTDTIPKIPGWSLVWNDEFSDKNIDQTKWSHEVNGDGGGNNELQYYTARAENSHIENGNLIIEARKESYLGKNYTSARMRTLKKGDWTYGRFDVRAKLPFGQGIWPAFWMLPTDWEYGGWPLSGEIDIMELLGHETTKVYGTIHYGPPHQYPGGSYILPTGTFVNAYHVFTVVWDSLGFTWYVDDVKYFSVLKEKPFDKRFHILLNLAVGGNWPGSPNEFTTFPQAIIVDYVRVYMKSN